MRKIMIGISLAVGLLSLTACSHQEKANEVRVGTIAGPETTLMSVAKKVALEKFGLHVKIITFTDYNTPNQALEDGEIDANAFQHYPFLLSQIQSRQYHLVPVGDTFLYPMGLYSKTIKQLSDLKPGAKIAIPNDPSNEARALLLLQKAGLITLKPNVTINATVEDIATNPSHYQFIALDAAELPRSLQDVSLAAINTNYAMPAGLSPSKDALFAEKKDSPYMNLIVARAVDKNATKIKELVEAYQSKPVLEKAQKLFGDGEIPGFTVSQ
jgi:D-methionine transport system substrate-binding protein